MKMQDLTTRRTARTPAFRRTVTLNTEFTMRVYKRVWDHLKADIFVLTVRTRTLDMEEAAQSAEKFISEEFAKVRNDIVAESERLEVLLKDAGISELPRYSEEAKFEAEYTSPQANEFLKILETLDVMLMRMDAAWLASQIATRQRTARPFEYQRRLIKLANRIRDYGGRARGAHAQAQRAKRQADNRSCRCRERRCSAIRASTGRDDAAHG